MTIAHRLEHVKASATLVVAAKAKLLKSQGLDIIDMSLGEPDFDTPDFVKAAAIAAINNGQTKYTAVDGTPELKAAICEKFKRDNHLDYKPENVMATAGAKQGLYNLCMAILNEGDEVIVPAPYWVSYPPMALLAGAVPVIIETDIHQQFKITAAQLEKAITPKTKLFFLNSPSNPTGMIYTRKELAELGEVLKKHPQVIIASDEIYEYIVWNPEGFSSILNVCPELKDRTVIFNGCSKAQAMTGWRLGYAAGPVNIIKAMSTIQSQSTSNPCSITEAAGVVAIAAKKSQLQYMFDAFKKRHDIFYREMTSLPLLKTHPADGTFYLFVDAEKAIKKLDLKDDIQLAEYLLEKALVACVPGSAFGAPNCLRFSYALADAQLEKAVERLKKALS